MNEIEPFCINLYFMRGGVKVETSFQDRIYDARNISPAVTTCFMPWILEEVKMNDEVKCEVIGEMDNTVDHTFESANRVHSIYGLAPACNTCGGGGLQTKILVKQATKEGYIEMEEGGVFDGSFPESETRRGRVQDGGRISPTLTAGNQELYRIERDIPIGTKSDDNAVVKAAAIRGRNPEQPTSRSSGLPTEQMLEINQNEEITNTLTTVQKDNVIVEKPIRCGQVSNDGSQVGTVYSDEGVSQTLCACTHGYAMGNIVTDYRIRKLTPKECYRLMGVTDQNAEKMLAVNSNSQCYKQAGNSIVVDVMAAMFRKLF